MNQVKHTIRIEHILTKIRNMLLDLGFVPKIVSNNYRDEINYVSGDLHCIFQYEESLGFFIEYAESYEEAKNHGHEDGDVFPLKIGEEKILSGIKHEILEKLKEM